MNLKSSLWEGFSVSVGKKTCHLYNLLLHFFQDGAQDRIAKNPAQCSSRSELNGSLVCTWSGIPHSFSKHFRVTFANYRFLLGFGVLEASMEILPSPLSPLPSPLSPLLEGFELYLCQLRRLCVWKGVKMRNKPILRWFLGLPCNDVSYHCNSKWKSHRGPEKKSGGSLNTSSLCFFPEKNKPQKFSGKKVFNSLPSVIYPHFQLTISILLIPCNSCIL